MESRIQPPEKEQPRAEKRTAPEPHGETYLYRDSGIQERHGRIPLWLILVSIGLVLWGIYYTVRYWSAG